MGELLKELKHDNDAEHEIKAKEFIELSTTFNEIKEKKLELKRKQTEINQTIKLLNDD
jgi:hypothetical protein